MWSLRGFSHLKNTNAFHPKPVVTYKWSLNSAKAALLSLLFYFRLPGRLHFSCSLAWSCTSQAYNSFITSSLVMLQCPWTIKSQPTLPRPLMPDVLTVKGIPGDLTSHGWMQGAFTSPLTASRIHSVHIQPRVLSGDIIRTRPCSRVHGR